MRCRKRIAMTGFALSLLLCGCAGWDSPEAARDRQVFDLAAERIESGGSYYRISNPAYLLESLDALRLEVERSVVESRLPPDSKRRIQFVVSMSELLFRLSGAKEIRAEAASSVRCGTESGSALFRNRAFVLLPEKSRGAFWKLFGGANRNLIDNIAGLPVGTVMAADFNFDPSALIEAVRRANTGFSDRGVCKKFTGMTPEELAKNMAGEWGVVFFVEPGMDPKNPENIHFVFSLPDRGGKLFARIQRFCRPLPGCRVTGDTVQFKGLNGLVRGPLLVANDGDLVLCSSQRGWKYFASSSECVGDTPAFRRLAAEVPADGVGIVYCDGNRVSNLEIGGVAINLNVFDRLPNLQVFRRERNGFLMVGCGGNDFNKEIFSGVVLGPLAVGIELYNRYGKFLLRKKMIPKHIAPEMTASPRKKPAPAPVDTSVCGKDIARIAAIVKSWSARHHGALPKSAAELGAPFRSASAPKNFKGPHYFWFSGEFKGENTGKIPLVLESPLLHDNAFFGVLYRDGSCEVVRLKNADSVKRAVSFLHTLNKYDEKDFLELIRQATEMDKAKRKEK